MWDNPVQFAVMREDPCGAGLEPIGDATILQAGMPQADWTRILTSEI